MSVSLSLPWVRTWSSTSLDGPLLPDRDVVGGHEAADGILGVLQQGLGDRPLLGREEGEEAERPGPGQFLEQGRAVVGGHAVEDGRLGFRRDRSSRRPGPPGPRYSNAVAAARRGSDPEHDDLILDGELGQHRRELAGLAVADRIADAREIPHADRGRNLVRRLGHVPDLGQGLFPLGSAHLPLHLGQSRAHDVVMMHMGTDRLHRVEPQAVDEREICRAQCGRMGAEVVGIRAPARVVDDEPNVERLGPMHALPCLPEQTRLVGGCQRLRLADVNFRRPQPGDGGRQRVEHVRSRHDQKPHRPFEPFGRRQHAREQALLRRRRGRARLRVVVHVLSEQANRHDDDVPIARALQRGRDLG